MLVVVHWASVSRPLPSVYLYSHPYNWHICLALRFEAIESVSTEGTHIVSKSAL